LLIACFTGGFFLFKSPDAKAVKLVMVPDGLIHFEASSEASVLPFVDKIDNFLPSKLQLKFDN